MPLRDVQRKDVCIESQALNLHYRTSETFIYIRPPNSQEPESILVQLVPYLPDQGWA